MSLRRIGATRDSTLVRDLLRGVWLAVIGYAGILLVAAVDAADVQREDFVLECSGAQENWFYFPKHGKAPTDGTGPRTKTYDVSPKNGTVNNRPATISEREISTEWSEGPPE